MSENLKKHEKKLLWAIILAEGSHIFCCLVPTIFSVLSLLSTFGLIIAMPGWLSWMHDTMHEYELMMIGLSAFVVVLGWGLHYLAHHAHVFGEHDHTCCDHDHGAPARASTTHRILMIATVLLVINVVVYFGFHRNETADSHAGHAHHEVHDDHHGHDH